MITANSRKRILFVGEAVSLAHVTRPLVLAQGLDPRRYEVHFGCGSRYRDLIWDAGFPVHDLPTLTPEKFFRNLYAGKPGYSEEVLRDYLRAEMKLLARLSPDLVAGDTRFSLALSCALAGVPYAAMINAHWSPYYALGFPVPDHPLTRLFGERLVRLIMPLALPISFRRLAAPCNRLRRAFGLPALPGLREVYCHGDWTLYFDIPELSPTRGLPPNHRYIGPALWEPDAELPGWRRFLKTGARRAYVTMGTSGDDGAVIRTVEALRQLGCEVMVTAKDPLPWTAADGVFSAPMLPGRKAAALADLVVCHGGSGTVYQALSEGVPVLGLCVNADQQLVMQGVGHAGAGIGLLARRATAESIAAASRRLLAEGGFRESARRLSARIAQSDAPQAFAKFVEEVLGAAGPAVSSAEEAGVRFQRAGANGG
jgi:UDP:flavonoid glycosyltransferase YjiC (YdhE family)